MLPEKHCTKTGEHVLEVLCTKYPDALPPSAACMNNYTDKPPEMVPVNITDDVVSAVAGHLLGGAGQGGLTQSVSNTGSSASGQQVVI